MATDDLREQSRNDLKLFSFCATYSGFWHSNAKLATYYLNVTLAQTELNTLERKEYVQPFFAVRDMRREIGQLSHRLRELKKQRDALKAEISAAHAELRGLRDKMIADTQELLELQARGVL